jgi:RimJ/RimL family protein N-acetyltransferase
MHRLRPSEYPLALPILGGVEHALLVNAILEGTAPGWVAIDDRDAPRTLFASGPEGHYLVGDPGNLAFNEVLGKLILEEIIPQGREAGWAVFNLHYHPDSWEAVLDAMLGDTVVVKNHQRYFKHRRRVEWRDRLPPGFEMRRVDAGLFAETHLTNLEQLRAFSESGYPSLESFLEHGFGFCLVAGDEIVSWCTSDCVIGHRCEVGIRTHKDHRRRGFATLTSAAAIDYCLSQGISDIGWHCWSQNLASAAAAERAGFEEVLQHHAIHLWLNPVDGLLVNGNLALMRGQYREAAQFFEQAFTLRDGTAEGREECLLDWKTDDVIYYYHTACAWALAGERDAALANLEKALARGTFRQAGY